jgi:hypothetical protein
MKRTCFSLPLAAASIVFALVLFSPAGAGAAEIIVPTDHAHIQDAITAAAIGDTVVVEPGTYQETFALKDGVEVLGRETARTILDGGGTGVIVTAGPIATAIRNFTFVNALVGIQASGSALDITNNVFEVGTTNNGTAIVVLSSPSTTISNNTFYGNNTAVNRDADLTIINNVFANNNTIETVVGSSAASTKINYNDYYNNISGGPTGANSVAGDPVFVDPANRDFHLQATSACIDKGDPSFLYNDIIDGSINDIGAYGGPAADPIPFPVQGLTITSTTSTSIELNWLANKCYLDLGDHYVYYGYAKNTYDGTDADSGTSPSPISVGTDNTYTLMDLNPLARVPAAPVLDQPVAGDTTLTLTWSAVPNAAGYFVHYGKSSPGEFTIDAGNAISYTITGLTNGQDYHLAVTAYNPAAYFVVVTAWDSSLTYESAYSSEVSTQLGPPLESGLSNIQTEMPDAVVHYPGLPNKRGYCFIATSAYGSYFAPEVRVLRAFRDRYLLTNSPGRLFVQWYYRNGPSAAALLDAHPAYKPAVRAALMPVVGAAFILTNTSSLFRAVLLVLGSAAAIGLLRKRFSERSVPR